VVFLGYTGYNLATNVLARTHGSYRLLLVKLPWCGDDYPVDILTVQQFFVGVQATGVFGRQFLFGFYKLLAAVFERAFLYIANGYNLYIVAKQALAYVAAATQANAYVTQPYFVCIFCE
jgi:hypothetical protein